MASNDTPPFSITASILTLVAEISECVGKVTVVAEGLGSRRLRRINRVRTIYGTLASEGNRLTEEQTTAILDGKRVLTPHREVQEVRNALLAYDSLHQWTPSKGLHLLDSHRILMTGLVDHPGAYRSGDVRVMAGEAAVHMAPPANQVPALMDDLFGWLGRSTDHPLITSSVFHYELEFIHPFADGNGRMGRLWQTLLLSRWRPLFADLPIADLVYANQGAYYQAIQDSTSQASVTPFITFMLRMMQAALEELESAGLTEQVTEQVRRLLEALGPDICPAKNLMDRLGLTHRPNFLYDYLRPALDNRWDEMTDPGHPRSPRQRYRLTAAGQQVLTS